MDELFVGPVVRQFQNSFLWIFGLLVAHDHEWVLRKERGRLLTKSVVGLLHVFRFAYGVTAIGKSESSGPVRLGVWLQLLAVDADVLLCKVAQLRLVQLAEVLELSLQVVFAQVFDLVEPLKERLDVGELSARVDSRGLLLEACHVERSLVDLNQVFLVVRVFGRARLATVKLHLVVLRRVVFHGPRLLLGFSLVVLLVDTLHRERTAAGFRMGVVTDVDRLFLVRLESSQVFLRHREQLSVAERILSLLLSTAKGHVLLRPVSQAELALSLWRLAVIVVASHDSDHRAQHKACLRQDAAPLVLTVLASISPGRKHREGSRLLCGGLLPGKLSFRVLLDQTLLLEQGLLLVWLLGLRQTCNQAWLLSVLHEVDVSLLALPFKHTLVSHVLGGGRRHRLLLSGTALLPLACEDERALVVTDRQRRRAHVLEEVPLVHACLTRREAARLGITAVHGAIGDKFEILRQIFCKFCYFRQGLLGVDSLGASCGARLLAKVVAQLIQACKVGDADLAHEL